jgi:hypothetical protein
VKKVLEVQPGLEIVPARVHHLEPKVASVCGLRIVSASRLRRASNLVPIKNVMLPTTLLIAQPFLENHRLNPDQFNKETPCKAD